MRVETWIDGRMKKSSIYFEEFVEGKIKQVKRDGRLKKVRASLTIWF